ncbi:hypothetical protein B0G81_3770 [Paraburkholderia sp. BL6665CI2N2]|nr:hypothetical protein B0G81_3770 [Paraburkholderia sp. BL6665CI2N2]
MGGVSLRRHGIRELLFERGVVVSNESLFTRTEGWEQIHAKVGNKSLQTNERGSRHFSQDT